MKAKSFPLFLAASLLTSTSHAATAVWSGAASTAWSVAGNWSPAAPVNGDFLAFTQGAPTNQPSHNDIAALNVGGMSFLNGTFTAPITLGGNDFTLTSPAAVAGATIVRIAASATATVTLTAHGLVSGQVVTISGAVTANLNGSYAITVIDANTFTYVSGATTAVAGDAASYNPVALYNYNAAASRNVTIGNNIAVSGAQAWGTLNDTDAVTILSGNLTGSGDIAVATSNVSAGTTLPNLRLTGTNNSGYTGTITQATAGSTGLLLGSAGAMTGGLIDLGTNDKNLWLTGGGAAYTFGINGTETSGARVAFRNGGTSGLYLTGGDLTWKINGTTDYNWSGATGLAMDINGSNDALPRTLSLGDNTTGNLTISGADKVMRNANGGNNPSRVTLNYALTDDAAASRTLSTSLSLLSLTKPAISDGNPLGLTITGGATAVTNMNQIGDGWLNLNGGVILLDGVSWSDFTTDRSAGFRSSTGTANTWGGGGFAARGSDVSIFINASTAAAYGTITAGEVFNRNFALGSALRSADGTLYANAGVTISQDTVLSAVRTISLGANGVGTGPGTPVLNKFSGNLTGAGGLIVLGVNNFATAGELVLSGTNSSTGAPSLSLNTGLFMNVGAGGMIVNNAIVRFEGDAALPTGNGGGTAYLSAQERNSSTNFGYLLTGSALGATYDLPAGAKFMITTATNSAPSTTGIFGADGGKATLRSSSILLNGSTDVDALTLNFLTRAGSELTLGTSGNAVNLMPTFGSDVAASATATAYANSATATRLLIKRGEGTLILGNLAYTQLDGATDASARFINSGAGGVTPASGWVIGRGATTNSGITAYSDGAVRGLSFDDAGATNSNSLKNFFLGMRGGVYEIDNTGGSGSTFTATLGTSGVGKVNLGNVSGTTGLGGGGFAAFGGDVAVTLTAVAGGANLTWASSGSAFIQNNDSLLLGSETATAKLTLNNSIALSGAVREIRVIDNANSTTDRAAISGNLTGTGASGINKTGAGTLELSGAANAYAGITTVSAGTLLVNGANTGTGAVTVNSGAAIGGSGTIAAPTTLQSNGKLAFNLSTNAAGHDKLDLASLVNAGTTTVVITSSGGASPGLYTLATAAGGFSGAGSISTVPSLPFGWAGSISIAGNDVILNLTSTSGGASPYDDWADDFAGFSPTSATLDFDNDGLKNLMEFVLGGNPTLSQANIAPTASASGVDLVITFKRSDASELQPVAVKVQISDDLTFSTPANDILIGAVSVAVPIAPTGATYTVAEGAGVNGLDTVTVTIPKAAAAKKFARVVGSN